MHLQKQLSKIAAYITIAAVALANITMSSPLAVYAQTTTTLYGSGSDDDINIVKLLDMALNKGGLSMSPATIQSFLEFWWNSVKDDLGTCINNAGTTITTTADLIDYCKSTLQNPDADSTLKVPSLCLRYVDFCVKMSNKSLSDFKQLITQEGTFREFLLSFVTDESGNTADKVNNKLQKYNIGKSLVNMAREAADKYIEEYEGYWLVPTLTYKDVNSSRYSKKVFYQLAYDSLKTIPENKYIYYHGFGNIIFNDITGYNLVGRLDSDGRIFVSNGIYRDDWSLTSVSSIILTESAEALDFTQDILYNNSKYSSLGIYSDFSKVGQDSFYGTVFTNDGHHIKVWKSFDAFKAYSVGQSNIYYSKDYSSFDSSVDNSVTFSGDYYNGSYSHDTIQNNIDNSSEINESTVNSIVNNYITNNNYGSGSDSGDNSGSSSGGWWDIGTGIDAFIRGLASLLDFILKLLGDLVGLLGEFLSSVLAILSSLTSLGQGFGEFLQSAFLFLPDECISLIISSIGAMCVVGVIKVFKS